MTDDRIRERAYQSWEAEGRPAAQEAEHWNRARQGESFPSEGDPLARSL